MKGTKVKVAARRRLELNDFKAAEEYAKNNIADPFAKARAMTALAFNYVLASDLEKPGASLI